MRNGTFKIPKEVYDRAKAHGGYLAREDEEKYFSTEIRCGYGLYDCKVHEEDGKYICTWSRGDTCD